MVSTVLGKVLKAVAVGMAQGTVAAARLGLNAAYGVYNSGHVRTSSIDTETHTVVESTRVNPRKMGVVAAVVVGLLNARREVANPEVLTVTNLQLALGKDNTLEHGDVWVSPEWTNQVVSEKMDCVEVADDGVISENGGFKVNLGEVRTVIEQLRVPEIENKIRIASGIVSLFNNCGTLVEFFDSNISQELLSEWIEIHGTTDVFESDQVTLRNLRPSKLPALSVGRSQRSMKTREAVRNLGTDLEQLIWAIANTRLTERTSPNKVESDSLKMTVIERLTLIEKEVQRQNDMYGMLLSVNTGIKIMDYDNPTRGEYGLRVAKDLDGLRIGVMIDHDNFKTEVGSKLQTALESLGKIMAIVPILDIEARAFDVVDYVRFVEGLEEMNRLGLISRKQVNQIKIKFSFPGCEDCPCKPYCTIPNQERIEVAQITSEEKDRVSGKKRRWYILGDIAGKLIRLKQLYPNQGRDRVLGGWNVLTQSDGSTVAVSSEPVVAQAPSLVERVDELGNSVIEFLRGLEEDGKSVGQNEQQTASRRARQVTKAPTSEEPPHTIEVLPDGTTKHKKISIGTGKVEVKKTSKVKIPKASATGSVGKSKQGPKSRTTNGGKSETIRQQPQPLHIEY